MQADSQLLPAPLMMGCRPQNAAPCASRMMGVAACMAALEGRDMRDRVKGPNMQLESCCARTCTAAVNEFDGEIVLSCFRACAHEACR